MSIITLTTDLGTKDHYVSSVKGAILSACPDTTIVDVSHHVEPFDIVRAAFVLRNSWQDFPTGTQHLVSINTMDNKDVRFLYMIHEGHAFLGADNGLFSLVFDKHPQEIYEIDSSLTTDLFPAKDILAVTACRIENGEEPKSFMKPVQNMQQRTTLQPVVQERSIRGTVIYVDAYENVLVNITRELFEQYHKDRSYVVYYRRNDYLQKIHDNYYDVPPGEPIAFFNAAGFLEIAINRGRASSLLGLDIGDVIQIDFE
jgi:S-adenosylmethionine hydrolase